MRKFLPLLSLLLLFSCSENTYELEDQLYDCVLSQAESQNIDLIRMVNNKESEFIRRGVLSDSSGKAKVQFYQETIETGVFPNSEFGIQTNSYLIEFMDWFDDTQCTNKWSKTDKLKSKYVQLRKSIGPLIEAGKTTPQEEAKAILSVLNAKDFEHPYFKTYFALRMNYHYEMIHQKWISQSKNPAPNAASTTTSNKQSIVIAVSDNGAIWINQVLVNDRGFHFRLGNQFSDITSNIQREVRIISNSDSTSHIGLAKDISSAHGTLLDNASIDQFNKPYYAITDKQRQFLNEKNPLQIKYEKP